jgi:type II secretion system protein H
MRADQRTGPPVRLSDRPPGFTLVEVIVVLAILGIMAAAVVPAYRNLAQSDELTQASDKIASVLRYARKTALQETTDLTLLVDPGSGRYWVYADSGESVIAGSWQMPEGIAISSSSPRPRFTFRRNGEAEGDSLLLRSGASTIVIWVHPWSGDVDARRDGQE